MKSPEYLLVINHASLYGSESIRDLLKIPAYADIRIILLTNNPKKYAYVADEPYPSEIIDCQFTSDEEIKAVLAPFKDHIRAVICRGEKNIQYFRMVIPHLPSHVLVATPEALEAATNKRLMREAFLRHAPEITPQFVQVHDSSAATLDAVEGQLAYPVIVKPANLASSLLIQACQNRDELEKALGRVFATVADVYQKQERHGTPQVIVEEYLEGDFYSVDAYVMKPGEFYFCPVVGYVPAKQMGIDDFFLYKRFVPAALTGEEIAAANEAVAKSLTAIGLTHSSAHVEMVLAKNGWKIIELGPRLGRFRHKIYKAAYGIDHSLNDLLIHFGQKPEIPTKLLQHCSAYSIYPEQEGVLREIRGIESVQNNPMTQFLRIFAKAGDACVHAKNGGGPLAEFVIADKNATAFNKTVTFIEETVKPVVDQTKAVA